MQSRLRFTRWQGWQTAWFLAALLGARAGTAAAQSSNGTYTLLVDTVSSGGERIGGGNPMAAQSLIGIPASGLSANQTVTLVGGIGFAEMPEEPPVTLTITVTGTVQDAGGVETLSINGAPAHLVGTTFTAEGVLLRVGANPISVTARDRAGNSASAAITVYLDLPEAKKTPRSSIPVTGTVSQPVQSVIANGLGADPADLAQGRYTIPVPLRTGLNTITVTAVDAAGNPASRTIRVTVPQRTRPPAMPTVGTRGDPLTPVSDTASLRLGGTKTAGVSIWINGAQAIPADGLDTWELAVTLVEGDNEFVIVAKDALGVLSATVYRNIILDLEPPKISFSPPNKTNLTPAQLTGSVDDSLTTVTVNGITADRTRRAFEVAVPLVPGDNLLHLVATSPNNLISAKDVLVILGAIPAIQAIAPQDGALLDAGLALTLTMQAQDADGDPVHYELLLDSLRLGQPTDTPSWSWTPPSGALGLHTLTGRAWDDYGGADEQDAEVFVIRPAISPP